MGLDVLPGRAMSAAPLSARRPRILVFDSGLGGLTVLGEVVKDLPAADVLFAADDAVFPYGRLSEAALVDRVMAVMERLVALHEPDVVVVACNTASTLVLPPMRARWPAIAVVGTVPAIKPAAALSQSRLISVLATPGTVARQYTKELVRSFAGDCAVTLAGAPRLAALTEAAMRGEAIDDQAIEAEIRAAFVEVGGRRTDVVVLACTHYPLLLERLNRLAPWPVTWIDTAPAIARRVRQMAKERHLDVGPAPTRHAPVPALFTSGLLPGGALKDFLAGRQVAAQPGEPF